MKEKLLDERGSTALELAIVTPLLIALIALVIACGRVAAANQHVDGAAHSAARAASIERDGGSAQESASSTAESYLSQEGLTCRPGDVTVDTSAFNAEIGDAGQVDVDIACTVSMGDLTGIIPVGQMTLTADAVSPVDAYRGQQ